MAGDRVSAVYGAASDLRVSRGGTWLRLKRWKRPAGVPAPEERAPASDKRVPVRTSGSPSGGARRSRAPPSGAMTSWSCGLSPMPPPSRARHLPSDRSALRRHAPGEMREKARVPLGRSAPSRNRHLFPAFRFSSFRWQGSRHIRRRHHVTPFI
jgi:hypothetical protein